VILTNVRAAGFAVRRTFAGHIARPLLAHFSDANEIHSTAAASRFAGLNENSRRELARARGGGALTFMNGI